MRDEKLKAVLDKARAAADADDNEETIRFCTEALALEPNEILAYLNRGHAYLIKDDYDRAIADFEHALKLEPDAEDAKEGLAEVQRERDAQEGVK
jgi:tetratricopeptide (TPR) repeat protein